MRQYKLNAADCTLDLGQCIVIDDPFETNVVLIKVLYLLKTTATS